MVRPVSRIVPDVSDLLAELGAEGLGLSPRRTLTRVPAALAPRLWLGHLLALVLVGAAGLLGVWQVDAWQTRRADEARDLTRAEPVPLTDVLGPDDPFPGRSVGQPVSWRAPGWRRDGLRLAAASTTAGRLLDGHPAGHRRRGRSRRCRSCCGWVADPTRAPAPPEGSADLVGWLQPPEGTGDVDDDPGDDVLPQLRIADIVQHVDQDLYGAYAIAQRRRRRAARGRLGQLPDAGRFTAVRNLSTRSSGGSSAPSRC